VVERGMVLLAIHGVENPGRLLGIDEAKPHVAADWAVVCVGAAGQPMVVERALEGSVLAVVDDRDYHKGSFSQPAHNRLGEETGSYPGGLLTAS